MGSELRKSIDTRSGRVLIPGLVVTALGWQLWHVSDTRSGSTATFGATSSEVPLLLPIIGMMAMTSDGADNLHAVSRRILVQIAKLVAGIVLSTVLISVVILLTPGGTAIGGAVADSGTAS